MKISKTIDVSAPVSNFEGRAIQLYLQKITISANTTVLRNHCLDQSGTAEQDNNP
jgi:hypothetical protein